MWIKVGSRVALIPLIREVMKPTDLRRNCSREEEEEKKKEMIEREIERESDDNCDIFLHDPFSKKLAICSK